MKSHYFDASSSGNYVGTSDLSIEEVSALNIGDITSCSLGTLKWKVILKPFLYVQPGNGLGTLVYIIPVQPY